MEKLDNIGARYEFIALSKVFDEFKVSGIVVILLTDFSGGL